MLQQQFYSNALHAMLPAWPKGSHLIGCLLACARAVGALRDVPARYVLTLRVLIADAMMLTWSVQPTRPLLSSMDETRFGWLLQIKQLPRAKLSFLPPLFKGQ